MVFRKICLSDRGKLRSRVGINIQQGYNYYNTAVRVFHPDR